MNLSPLFHQMPPQMRPRYAQLGAPLARYRPLHTAAATWQLRILLQHRASGRVGSIFVPGIPDVVKP
jgi:hypothetical protein